MEASPSLAASFAGSALRTSWKAMRAMSGGSSCRRTSGPREHERGAVRGGEVLPLDLLGDGGEHLLPALRLAACEALDLRRVLVAVGPRTGLGVRDEGLVLVVQLGE